MCLTPVDFTKHQSLLMAFMVIIAVHRKMGRVGKTPLNAVIPIIYHFTMYGDKLSVVGFMDLCDLRTWHQ